MARSEIYLRWSEMKRKLHGLPRHVSKRNGGNN